VFFFLSKILDVLLSPLAWSVALLVVGLTGKPGKRRWAGFAGILVLLFFSLEPVSNALFRSLETPPIRTVRDGVTYDVVILLGGVSDERAETTWGQRAYNENNERLLETYDRLRTGAARYAIVSGGSLSPTPKVEARVLADQLIAWGISPDRVVVEDRARNTHENAVNSAAIVRARGWQSVLLVTSANHMPRAYGCFVAEGLPADTLPVDFRSYGSAYTGELIPRESHLERSSAAIREWFGRVVYRARGYTR
jgi:uncharacterized SAM-binding protein YcdF (DUF218 family)